MLKSQKRALIRRRVGKMFLTVLVLGPLSLLMMASLWAESVPPEVVTAARDGLPRYLDAIPGSQMHHFGFTSEDEFATTTVGTPFRIYAIPPADIISFRDGDDISSVVFPTNLWLFPIVCSGVSRTVLTVDLMDEEWTAVDLGASSLATEMDDVAEYLSQFEGHETRFLRIYQASCDFILLTKDTVSHLVPLRSAAYALRFAEEGEVYRYATMDPSQVMPALVPIVQGSLDWEQR